MQILPNALYNAGNIYFTPKYDNLVPSPLYITSGPLLEAPVRSLLIKQKEKLHGGGSGDNSGSIVSSVFEIFVLSMVSVNLLLLSWIVSSCRV